MNTVVLVGRLTREVDLRFTQSGIAVGSFTLAVDRQFTNQQGERETDFIRCVMWRKSAENFANFTRKGSLVGVEGRIQTRSYDNQQGERVYITEVVCDNFQLLEPKSVTEQRPRENNTNSFNNNFNNGDSGFDNQFGGFDNQFDNQPRYNGPSRNNSNDNAMDASFDRPSPFHVEGAQDVNISQDDLPF